MKLRVTRDHKEIGICELVDGEYVVGRSPNAQFALEDESVAAEHVRFTVLQETLTIENLAGATLIGTVPLQGSQVLSPGEVIRIGQHVLEVWDDRSREVDTAVSADGRYFVGELVAQGAMGAIRRAREATTGREVAMKRMHPNLEADNAVLATRFLQEAKLTAHLEHPNVVPVHDVYPGPEGPRFYTMKMVRGVSLDKVITLLTSGNKEDLEKYPFVALLTIFQKVCDAVAFAHSKGIIHRDLKPANIMIGEYGEVLVMDWGLAKNLGTDEESGSLAEPDVMDHGDGDLTMAGDVIGTPSYMAPEQASGKVDAVDQRTDVYALGAILYRLLTLQPPVEGATLAELLGNVREGKVVPPLARLGKTLLPHLPNGRIPTSLEAVVVKALAVLPDERYQKVTDLQEDLRAYQSGFATTAEDATVWRQFLLFVGRNKAVAGAIAASIALLVIISGFYVSGVLRERNRANLERDNARSAERDSLCDKSHLQARFSFAQGRLHDAADALRQAEALRSRWEFGFLRAKVVAEARRYLGHPERIASGIDCEGGKFLAGSYQWINLQDSQNRCHLVNIRTGERLDPVQMRGKVLLAWQAAEDLVVLVAETGDICVRSLSMAAVPSIHTEGASILAATVLADPRLLVVATPKEIVAFRLEGAKLETAWKKPVPWWGKVKATQTPSIAVVAGPRILVHSGIWDIPSLVFDAAGKEDAGMRDWVWERENKTHSFHAMPTGELVEFWSNSIRANEASIVVSHIGQPSPTKYSLTAPPVKEERFQTGSAAFWWKGSRFRGVLISESGISCGLLEGGRVVNIQAEDVFPFHESRDARFLDFNALTDRFLFRLGDQIYSLPLKADEWTDSGGAAPLAYPERDPLFPVYYANSFAAGRHLQVRSLFSLEGAGGLKGYAGISITSHPFAVRSDHDLPGPDIAGAALVVPWRTAISVDGSTVAVLWLGLAQSGWNYGTGNQHVGASLRIYFISDLDGAPVLRAEIPLPDFRRLRPSQLVRVRLSGNGSAAFVDLGDGTTWRLPVETPQTSSVHRIRNGVYPQALSNDGTMCVFSNAATQGIRLAELPTERTRWERSDIERPTSSTFGPGDEEIWLGTDAGNLLELSAATGKTLRQWAVNFHPIAVSFKKDLVLGLQLPESKQRGRLVVFDPRRGIVSEVLADNISILSNAGWLSEGTACMVEKYSSDIFESLSQDKAMARTLQDAP